MTGKPRIGPTTKVAYPHWGMGGDCVMRQRHWIFLLGKKCPYHTRCTQEGANHAGEFIRGYSPIGNRRNHSTITNGAALQALGNALALAKKP
jgi:hypothetical protein